MRTDINLFVLVRGREGVEVFGLSFTRWLWRNMNIFIANRVVKMNDRLLCFCHSSGFFRLSSLNIRLLKFLVDFYA